MRPGVGHLEWSILHGECGKIAGVCCTLVRVSIAFLRASTTLVASSESAPLSLVERRSPDEPRHISQRTILFNTINSGKPDMQPWVHPRAS